MSALPTGAAVTADLALPKRRVDYFPMYSLAALMAVAFLWIGSGSTWLTLTVAGLAMGMLLFIMASGLTMVFGLMGVMNFGHGAFITVGAYAATLVLLRVPDWLQADSGWLNAAALALALLVAMTVTALLGWLYERVIIRRVYGDALMQILITFGAATVLQELVTAIWGPELIPLTLPAMLDGVWVLGDAVIEKYRVMVALAGLALYGLMSLVLHGTRIGLLVRAAVANGEMVEALGYRVRRLFVGVFVAGAALAGMGGVLWGLYRQELNSGIGAGTLVSVLIVIIVGGLGSVGGCFIASLLVALASNYIGFLAPKAALVSEVGIMLLVLAWRPRGLYPVTH